MSDTTVTYTLSGAEFTDGTTVSGTFTAEYDPAGQIVDVTDSAVVATGPGGATLFSGAYPLSYANPTGTDDYEITFPANTGGSYQGLYLDFTGETPAALNGGDQVPYTSIQLGGTTLTLSEDGTITETVACFARGTRIATPSGDVAVEAIEPGTLLTLARGGSAPVKWVGHRRLRPAASKVPPSVQPVAVAQGALGDGLPLRELRLSPEHAVFIGGLLVPVGLLVNGRSIVQLDVETVEYFHVELDGHDIILAEGAPAETYLDTGNRSIFANAPLVALYPRLRPTFMADAVPCAEMMFDGAWLQRLRSSLAAIADGLDDKDRAAG